MKRLLLVRHGESEWNSIRRLQGQADISLSERGRAQALALKNTVADLAPDRVATSDLSRARVTAELLGFPQAERRTDLRENHVGDWTGQGIADLVAADPTAYAGWRAGTHTPPGGESWAGFAGRTRKAVLSLSEETAATLLVVAHGGVIRALLESFLGISPKRIIPVGPASLTILRRQGESLTDMRLELFNYSPTGPILDAPD
ncbi:histidine phosphatase family protein [Aureimonas populi]|uniref:Histidine phosphatase family protein n=1 Tax=Aureimonas populi TaxID=1701758 RepID=A0ABW5CKI1_9HYPH|nr:histidine phosphatase family protein [Aureimonas populi]